MKSVFKGVTVIALFVMSSCAKEYSCECEVVHEQSAQGFSEKKEWDQSTDMKGKEDEMKSACEDMSFDESYTDAGGFSQKISYDCRLR